MANVECICVDEGPPHGGLWKIYKFGYMVSGQTTHCLDLCDGGQPVGETETELHI